MRYTRVIFIAGLWIATTTTTTTLGIPGLAPPHELSGSTRLLPRSSTGGPLPKNGIVLDEDGHVGSILSSVERNSGLDEYSARQGLPAHDRVTARFDSGRAPLSRRSPIPHTSVGRPSHAIYARKGSRMDFDWREGSSSTKTRLKIYLCIHFGAHHLRRSRFRRGDSYGNTARICCGRSRSASEMMISDTPSTSPASRLGSKRQMIG